MKGLLKPKLIFPIVIVVMVAAASVSLAVSAVHLQSAHAAPNRPFSGNPKGLKQAESAWFQLSHFGSGPVSPDARIQAFTQANQLAQISSTSTLTSPPPFWTKPWHPLGPAPLNSNCGAFCNNNGLVSGRVTAEAVDPNHNQEVWVGTADGGVWKSIDRGAHWTPTTDKQPTLAVGSIAVDPNTNSVIYVGTGEANFNIDGYWGIGILKSTDDGATWKRYGLKQFGGLAIGRIAIDPANTHILLISVARMASNNPRPPTTLANLGIWRSTDGGLTWTQVLSGTDGTEVLFDPANPNIAFAGLGSGTSASGVYKSTNAGLTWTLISSGLPTGTAVERVSLGTSLNGSHLYAVLTATNPFGDLLGSAIYVSTDTGTTWTAKDVSGVPGMVNDNGEDQWWYESVDAVDPTISTGNTAYVGGTDFWKTTDGGNTWTNITQATTSGMVHAVHPDQHALVFPSTKSSSYYIGNDGGVWRGTASGTFTDLNTGGLNITQFYGGGIGNVGPDAQLYGGTQDNGTNQYPAGPIDGLKQWKTVLFGDGGDTVVDYTNNAIVYGETLFPTIVLWKTVNGATSWTQIMNGFNPSNANFVAPLIISPSNHNELFAATNRVFRTTDGGATWKALNGGNPLDGTTPISALAVAPSNDNVIYAGDNAGNVFVTTNGGTSWTGGAVPGSTGGMVRGIAVDPHSASTVYVSFANFANGSGHHVFKSTNGGTSWTDISKQLPNIPFSSLLFIKDDLVAGSDAGLFVSENGGSIWWRIDSGLPNVAIDQVFANASSTMLFLATHGRGMWTRSLS